MRGMERPRISGLAVIAIVAVALLISIYVAGYFALSDSIPNLTAGAGTVRVFRHKWLATIYLPAARVEAVVSGEQVGVNPLR